jgi:hypothetical protein
MEELLNLPLIQAQLARDAMTPVGALPWLEESYRKPRLFWDALKRAQDLLLPRPGKSTPFGGYDFYHDLVSRSPAGAAGASAPAFKWRDPAAGWREISYSSLGTLASRKAAQWLRAGVGAGEVLCIVMPLGVDFVVALVAALKLGLTVCVLPPRGKGFLERRLEALAPDHIAVDELYLSLLPAWRDLVLEESVEGPVDPQAVERSHTYPSGSVVALCFDPASEASGVPTALTCDAAYLCAVRDGLIALGLRPGELFAAPGFHFLSTQPALLLAGLLAGAGYVHLEEEEVVKDPRLLAAQPLKVVGVSGRVRDVLTRNPVEVAGKWRLWFRDPAESADLAPWHDFVQALQLGEVLAGNLGWRAALGGCHLFSVRRKGSPHPNVLPSAGVPWQLGAPSGEEAESPWEYGSLALCPVGPEEGKGTPTGELIARSRREWLYLGSPSPRRAGRCYPEAEVLEAIRALPYGTAASVAPIPPSGGSRDWVFALVMFTEGKRPPDEASLAAGIKAAVEREMGGEFLPDRIHFFPLSPRRGEGGKMEHEWCRSQYLSGRLFRKARQEIFVCLSQLRKCLTLSDGK